MQEEDKSRIDDLNSSLYSRNAPDVRTRRVLRVNPEGVDVQNKWQDLNEVPVPGPAKKDHSMSFLVKLFIFSIVFCLAAVGLGAYLFLNGANLISANNIEVNINGPVSVPGGTPVTFDIAVTNKNNVDLQNADLAIIYPEGATDPANPQRELGTYHETIGSLRMGASYRKSVEAVIFGEQNIQKTIIVEVTYEVKGSNSPFTKRQSYDVLVNSSPVNLTVSSYKEITAGQEFDMSVNVKSNSGETLKNVLVSATYPFGFTFLSSTMKPLPDNALWRVGDLPPGGQKIITIHGKLSGEDQDARVFHFTVGSQSLRNPNAIGTEFMSTVHEIALKKSFMSVGLSLNNDKSNSDAAGSFNQPVNVEISWFNNLPTAISGAEIVVKLSGSAYDKSLVQANQGYFRSSTDEIVWNSQTTPKLDIVSAGEGGSVNFSITPRDYGTANRTMNNPMLSFSVSVRGKRTQETGVPENLSSIVSRNVRITSSASLSGRVLRTQGPFTNTGPIPPRVDQKSTYTITWTIDNTANVLNKTQVSATLPPYIKWMNNVSPSGEDIAYEVKSGTVTWNAGVVNANTARTGQRKTVSFQISYEPSINQLGSVPVLMSDSTMTATDDFTGATIHSAQPYLTTRFSTDPAYKPGDEIVVQ